MGIAYTPLVFDRVKETSTSIGTSSFTLAGASTGYRSFFSAAGNSVRLYYCIENPSAGEWEVGIGYVTSGTTLVRETILASTNSNTTVSFGAGTKNVFCTAPAAPLLDAFNSPNPNLLINGGFDFFQRQTPGTNAARSDDTYGPDRWYVLTQTAAINVKRQNTDGGNYVTLTQNQAAAQRLGLAQIVESKFSQNYYNKQLRFQCEISANGSTADMFVAILQYNGTADVVTSDVVNNWASTTYTPGNFFISSPLSVLGTSAISLPNDSTFYPVDVTGTPTENYNIIVFVWTANTTSQNVEISIRNAMLSESSMPCNFMPRPFGEELALCQRYYQKSYDMDTPPGSTGASGEAGMVSVNLAVAAATGNPYYTYPMGVEMRAQPTVTIYSPATGASGKLRNVNAGADRTAAAYYVGTRAFTLGHNDATVSADQAQLIAAWTAEAEL